VRHTFGTGEWVELIPLADLRIKHKKKLFAITNAIVPLNAEGDFDKAAITSRYGGWQAYQAHHSSTQFAALAALVVTAWSWDVPVPQITDGALIHAESVDEVPLELEDLLAPYLTRLTRDPDPKEVTSSSSNGVPPGRAKASRTA